jgi:hypothetical protein
VKEKEKEKEKQQEQATSFRPHFGPPYIVCSR